MGSERSFYLGCAVWAFKEWVGDFYPPGSKAGDFLRLYGQRLTAVEGNTTFYSIPGPSMVVRWQTETPETFRFCLKLPRTITHHGTLADKLPAALAFMEQMAPLGKRLGPVFAQLPPGYGPAAWEDLQAFLQAWPTPQYPLALEVRHPDWFQAPANRRLQTCLTTRGIGRVLLDTRPIYDCQDTGWADPQIASERRKPRLPLQPEVTAPFSLIRFISHPQLELNQPYIDEWVPRIHQWLKQGTQIYLFIHCPIEARSPQIARHFQQQLVTYGEGIPALPWAEVEQPPTQLQLF